MTALQYYHRRYGSRNRTARTTSKVRMTIGKTREGSPSISSFEAYNDTCGEVFNVARGGVPPARAGK